MKLRLVIASALLTTSIACGSLVCAGTPLSTIQGSSKGGRHARPSRVRKLRLGLAGFLPLPVGYKVYFTGRTVDAWGGYILSPDESLRIEWSAGMVQTPFHDGIKKFVWVKREKIGKGRLQYGLRRTDEGEMIAATVGFAHFTMPLEREGDKEKFLKIVRGYKMEQCDSECEAPIPAPPSNNVLQRTRRSAILLSPGLSARR